MNDKLLIGELSARSKVPAKTIRYYEDLGLLDRPKRTESGYRVYVTSDVEKLKFVKKAKSLGFTLSEIKEIILCSREGLKPCCGLVRKVFTGKVKEFEAKIMELQRMKKTLERLLAEWVPVKDARKQKYSVCPQIERDK